MASPDQAPPQADVLLDQAQQEAAARGLGLMNWLRNSRPGQLLADISMGAAVVLPGVGGTALAFNAEPVAADNVPALQAAEPEAQASYTPTRPCASTDSPSQYPQWHAHYSFNTPNGKKHINSIRPGGLTRFVARVAGGNLEAFSMDEDIYVTPKNLEVLDGGSHPSWSRAGGNPHWAIKELCHWKDKRNISFLVKVNQQAQIGKRLCMAFDVWGKTAEMIYPNNPPLQYRCLKVK